MPHERRVFEDLPDPLSAKDLAEIPLSPENTRHVCRVLRLEPGAQIVVVSKSTKREYDAILTETGGTAVVKLTGVRSERQPASRVGTLAFALTKGANNDLVCEKACELGAQRIIFWQAQRSVVRLTSQNDIGKKLSRWQKIAESASKQSCKNYVPEIIFAANVDELVSAIGKIAKPEDALLCCSLSPEATDLRSMTPPLRQVHLVIGPEGDFTQNEEAALVEQGFKLASLGEFILRSETAAIAAVSIAQGLWGPLFPHIVLQHDPLD